MKKLTITNFEALNIASWNAQLTKEKLDAMPLKIRYYLKKLTSKLMPDIQEFESFRDTEYQKLQDKYNNDEMSYNAEETTTDEDGNEKKQTVRKIKDDYLDEYQKEVNSLNEKLIEILSEKNTYECNTVDIDDIVENLPEDTPLEFDDINMIDAIFSENGEA